jgi:transposase
VRVEVAVKEQRINVWAQHAADARWACPKCKAELALYDHAEERRWRHLDSRQFQTFLLARIPRVECPTHGVLQVAVSWAEARSHFTVLFERFAIDVLRETSVTSATKLLRVSWDEAWGLMRRAVVRGQERKGRRVITRIGVDEKSVAKGQRYIWLYGHENLPAKHRERFDGLHALNLKTGCAWALKESLRTLWDNRNQSWARNHWASWNSWATRSKVKPVIAVARMVRSHLENVMTYFRHRITNAVAEGLNSKIQGIKKRAFGYRNKEHYKIAIFFHCGGLTSTRRPMRKPEEPLSCGVAGNRSPVLGWLTTMGARGLR